MVENSTLRRQLFIVFLRYYFGCQEKTASYFCLLKMLKSELLQCIKKFFAAGLLFRKGFGYDGNVFHISFRKCSTLVKSSLTKTKFLKNPKKFMKNLSACLKPGMMSQLRPMIAPDKRRRYMTLSLWSSTLYVIYGLETSFICQRVSPI